MRSANNSRLGETITTRMVVPLNENTSADQIYDATGMKVVNDGAGNQNLVQDPSMLGSPSDILRRLIRQGSGGMDSPYSWDMLSPETLQARGARPLINPLGPFSPHWNIGDHAAGFQQPGIKLPDYVTAKGSAFGLEGSISVNLHNGQLYGGAGGSVPVIPGASVTFGWLPSNYAEPNSTRKLKTDELLNGSSHSISACAYGVCLGGNHAIGGNTAIEIGIGTGGFTRKINLGGNAGTGAATVIFSPPEQQ